VPIFDTTLTGADSFAGQGASAQSNSLAGSLTVTVVDVQSNGNLVVQGDKTLKLNQGDEFVHIAGVIRPADIATNNTVTSDKLADAHISYSGKGAVNASNQMAGWRASSIPRSPRSNSESFHMLIRMLTLMMLLLTVPMPRRSASRHGPGAGGAHESAGRLRPRGGLNGTGDQTSQAPFTSSR